MSCGRNDSDYSCLVPAILKKPTAQTMKAACIFSSGGGLLAVQLHWQLKPTFWHSATALGTDLSSNNEKRSKNCKRWLYSAAEIVRDMKSEIIQHKNCFLAMAPCGLYQTEVNVPSSFKSLHFVYFLCLVYQIQNQKYLIDPRRKIL